MSRMELIFRHKITVILNIVNVLVSNIYCSKALDITTGFYVDSDK